MDDGAFQWDDDKADANEARHGVTFKAARAAFSDAFALDWRDERHAYAEDRYVILGMVDGAPAVCRLCAERRRDPDHLGERSRAA